MRRAPDLDGARRLLALVRQTGRLVELRFFPEPDAEGLWPEDDRARCRFVRSVGDAPLQQWRGMALRRGHGLAYGVVPRQRRTGELALAGLVWCDADFYKLQGGRGELCRRLADLEVPPSVVVSSGRGLHLLWQLERPVQPDVASEASRRLQVALGDEFDPGHAPGRFLRVPGTWNHRAGRWSKVESWDARKVAVEVLLRARPRDPGEGGPQGLQAISRPNRPGGHWVPPEVPASLQGDPHLVDLWCGRGRERGDLSPSGYDFALALQLLRCGWGVDSVSEIVAQRREYDRKSGSYSSRTVQAAARVAAGGRAGSGGLSVLEPQPAPGRRKAAGPPAGAAGGEGECPARLPPEKALDGSRDGRRS